MIAVVSSASKYERAHSLAMKKPDWDKRIRRAAELAERCQGATEVLTFYQHILAFQQQIYEDISLRPALPVRREGSFRAELDTAAAMKWLPSLLSLVQKKGPAKLALDAAALNQSPSERQQQVLIASPATLKCRCRPTRT